MGIHRIISDRLDRDRGVGAVWQFELDGATEDMIRHAAAQLREVHDGVYLSGHAPMTNWQRWKAATVTAPGTYLGLFAVGCFTGIRDDDRRPTTVRRIGTGGPRNIGTGLGRLDAIRVYPTDSLNGETTIRDGIDIVCPSRTLLDLIARDRNGAARMMRETLRKGIATPKSDAEGLAVDFLRAAKQPPPLVNVDVHGGEADLYRADIGLIVELDGPQFHQFPIDDAEKQARWERAGMVVRRVPTDDVYRRQHELLAAYADPISAAERAAVATTRNARDILDRWDAGGPAARRRADSGR